MVKKRYILEVDLPAIGELRFFSSPIKDPYVITELIYVPSNYNLATNMKIMEVDFREDGWEQSGPPNIAHVVKIKGIENAFKKAEHNIEEYIKDNERTPNILKIGKIAKDAGSSCIRGEQLNLSVEKILKYDKIETINLGKSVLEDVNKVALKVYDSRYSRMCEERCLKKVVKFNKSIS